MSLIKFFLICLVFTIASCDYLEKNFEKNSVPEKIIEDRLVFQGEVSVLKKQKITNISNQIDGKLAELRGFCKSPLNLQTLRDFTGKLQNFQSYTKQTYAENAYSFNNVNIKDGSKDVNLGLYLLQISSVLGSQHLKSAYNRNFSSSLNQSNLKTSCLGLRNSYRFSFAAYHNLHDGIKVVANPMSFLFKNIDDSISCFCK